MVTVMSTPLAPILAGSDVQEQLIASPSLILIVAEPEEHVQSLCGISGETFPLFHAISFRVSYEKPDHHRYARRAAILLGLAFDDLDDGGGYLFRVSDGSRELVLGAGTLCPYVLNSATAVSISKDKIFTNRLLSEKGIPNLGGRCFFLDDQHSKLRKTGYEVEDARRYLEELGYPCFVKPLAGSRGDYAEIVASAEQFDDYVSRVSQKHSAVVVQKII